MVATTIDREQLKTAFDAFNQQSSLLEASYRELQEQVEALTRQLVSEQAARVRQLEETERLSQRLSLLLESLPGGIVVIDGCGEILMHNSDAAELLGRPLLGCAWSAIVRRQVKAGVAEDGNIQLDDGRWLSLSRRGLLNEPGEIILLANITDSRRIAELRQRRERLSTIGEMTAEFAHQVRTPLASAMLYVSQLEAATPQQQRVAEKVGERLGDLRRMVDDMLVYASGSNSCSDRVDVIGLLNSAIGTVSGQLGCATFIENTAEDVSLEIEGNADALKGALLNLINNADQAGARRIVLDASASEDLVTLSVSDDGPGIPDELLPRLFEPFFTTRPQGTGLGLAVVQSVAAAHNGRATVASSECGATFRLELPVSP